MDNVKTGQFIRDLRREKNMTQRELADRLHITDRAVSKWERGLCAPEISLLEPLAEALGCSVLDLMAGERTARAADSQEEARTRDVLHYSIQQAHRRVGLARRWWLLATAVLALALLLGGTALWRSGALFVVARSTSPDGSEEVTVYSKDLVSGGFGLADATSLIVRHDSGGELRITYGGHAFQGLWWAPDSSKYVLALDYGGRTYLALAWLEYSSGRNLPAYLASAMAQNPDLNQYGWTETDGQPDIDFQFLQWGLDSQSMLIYYAFTGQDGQRHDGYFWYNCVDGSIRAVLELTGG